MRISINKKLKANLPQSSETEGIDIYITEDGGIYTNTISGQIVKIGVDTETKSKIDSIEHISASMTNKIKSSVSVRSNEW